MTGYVIAALALLAAAVVVLVNRRRTARTMERLDRMVTMALNGSFSETAFDETQLSALEARMARYLTASALSARNLQQQKEQIAALISDISHQTKTPVANLRLYAQLLAEQPLSPQGRDCVAALEAQSEKLETLIQALVKSSRLETGILTLHPAEGPLSPMVERAAAQYQPKAAEKSITLTVKETAGDAVFDAKWTEEALCNLLDNAVKYTPPGGSVTVTVRSYELFSAVCVTDTGPGIPEAEQAKIFRRFYRSPAAWQADGVGVGLYLTRQIAQGQGGYVKVSGAPGRGSTFSLYLPHSAPSA